MPVKASHLCIRDIEERKGGMKVCGHTYYIVLIRRTVEGIYVLRYERFDYLLNRCTKSLHNLNFITYDTDREAGY